MTAYNLTLKDYTRILQYYNLQIPSNKYALRKLAEDTMAFKLCSCIKKVAPDLDPVNEERAIGVCTASIFNKKGLERGTFKCLTRNRKVDITKKTKRSLSIKSGKTGKTRKTRKNSKKDDIM